MTELAQIFHWWHGSALQWSIVVLLCALGAFVGLAIVGINRQSEAERLLDDIEQHEALRAHIRAHQPWGAQE